MQRSALSILALVTIAMSTGTAAADDSAIDREASVFAVVTHKAGLAAKLAHNHLVVARNYDVELAFDPAAPEAARLVLDVPVASLVIDDPAEQARWQDRIVELGILTETFSEISEKDRAKIHKSMLSKKQLDGDRHPRLRAELVSAKSSGSGDFPFDLELKLEIVGKSVTRTLAGRFEVVDDRLQIEAHGELKFTDFGIAPYSAMLGAVRNDDPFHVYVYLERAMPAPEAAPEP